MRDTDKASHAVFTEVKRDWPSTKIELSAQYVSEPGFLPPLVKGRQHARGDIICFIDDDAEAHRDWLERLLSHYGTQEVGAVGGRCVTLTQSGEEVKFFPIKRNAARLSWFGRIETNMYRDLQTEEVQEAVCVMGGNCSYRRDILRQIKIDPKIANHVAYNWELDWGLQVRRMGYRIIFDPLAKVDHFSAPREHAETRDTKGKENIFWTTHNSTYILLKHLPPLKKILFLTYANLIGSTGSHGLLSFVYSLRKGWNRNSLSCVEAAFLGRLHGLKSYVQSVKEVNSDNTELTG
jgi:GT2 family glycosyltransferase